MVPVAAAPVAGVCQGMSRNGNFDLSCVLTPVNEVLIAGGILAVGVLAMFFLALPKKGSYKKIFNEENNSSSAATFFILFATAYLCPFIIAPPACSPTTLSLLSIYTLTRKSPVAGIDANKGSVHVFHISRPVG